MERLTRKSEAFRKKKDGFERFGGGGVGDESLTDSSSESRASGSSRSSSGTGTSMEEVKPNSSSSSPPLLGWPIRKAEVSSCSISCGDDNGNKEGMEFSNVGSKDSDMGMMKERFAKLLLGEDMSGSGKGVCTSLAISNAITNLCATIFGQLWRLEPLPPEKKSMWQREMEWLLSVSDHIVELIPSWQTFPDGSKLEVMTCRPRTDIFMNLPALKKLDSMLLEILESFTSTEFWYVDQGIVAPDADGSASFRKAIQRQEDKWWLPVPRVPADGLSESSRKQLHHTRECANQILKAAMAINNSSLAEMEVPDSYLEALPKTGRACLGDVIYRYIMSDQFSSECLLDCLDLSSEHVALDIANHVEASIHVWRRRVHPKPISCASRTIAKSKSSWEVVKDLMVDGDKRELLAERSESLLLSLKQRFPNLTQTTLDTSKIQFNKDVGKSILESYSRVLESLAYNIVARIDDLLYVDDLNKHSDKLSSVSTVSVISHKKVSSIPYSVSVTGTTHKKTFSTPLPLASPMKGERTPFLHSKITKHSSRGGFGVKRALTSYLGVDSKTKICSNAGEAAASCTVPNTNRKE